MNGIAPQKAKEIAAKRRARFRQMLKDGISQAEISRRYGISPQRVSQILKADS